MYYIVCIYYAVTCSIYVSMYVSYAAFPNLIMSQEKSVNRVNN